MTAQELIKQLKELREYCFCTQPTFKAMGYNFTARFFEEMEELLKNQPLVKKEKNENARDIKSYCEHLSALFSKIHIEAAEEIKDYTWIEEINTELRKIADDDFCRNFKAVAHRICLARKEKYINTYEMLADKAKKMLLSGINGSDVLKFLEDIYVPKQRRSKK